MKYHIRFFCNDSDNEEIIEIEAATPEERSDTIDALFEQDDRETRFDAAEW